MVAEGKPDVQLALWPPKRLQWSVALITSQPTVRLLGVRRGDQGGVGQEVLKISYDLSESGAEREAWRTLLGVLRKG